MPPLLFLSAITFLFSLLLHRIPVLSRFRGAVFLASGHQRPAPSSGTTGAAGDAAGCGKAGGIAGAITGLTRRSSARDLYSSAMLSSRTRPIFVKGSARPSLDQEDSC